MNLWNDLPLILIEKLVINMKMFLALFKRLNVELVDLNFSINISRKLNNLVVQPLAKQFRQFNLRNVE